MVTAAASPPAAVFFDLDGTLLDTAPDMVAALNTLLGELGQPAVPFERARCFVSNGAVGLLRLPFPGFDPSTEPAVHRRFLDLYAEKLCVKTQLFEGLEALLVGLESRGVPWGVVTNKPSFLTEPLLERLELRHRCACIVSGDTLPERKPHPRPVQYALECVGALPHHAIYVGDAPRDITAGRSAGARTVAVRYGYIEPGQDPAMWGADHVVGTVAELATLLAGETGPTPRPSAQPS